MLDRHDWKGEGGRVKGEGLPGVPGSHGVFDGHGGAWPFTGAGHRLKSTRSVASAACNAVFAQVDLIVAAGRQAAPDGQGSSMAKQPKYYVVWKGYKTGVFDSWAECQEQVNGFPGAKFKAFATRQAAIEAFDQDFETFEGQDTKTYRVGPHELAERGVILDSVCVDAACNGSPGDLEYRGVDTASGNELFHRGPYLEGTVNIGEFLAIVHALAVLARQGRDVPVYSDSQVALGWVQKKRVNTRLRRSDANRPLFELIERALIWLEKNPVSSSVLKWKTESWGENPADFGRK